MNYQDEADELLQSVLLHKNLFVDRETILKDIANKLECMYNKGYDAGRDRILNLSVQELKKAQEKMLRDEMNSTNHEKESHEEEPDQITTDIESIEE